MLVTPRQPRPTNPEHPTRSKDPVGSRARAPKVLRTDLTRGALQFDIRPPRVWLDALDLEDYRELHPVCGLNTAGVILGALSSQLRNCAAGEVPERLSVCLIRQKDHQAVEVRFSLRRVRSARGARWQLCLAGERPVTLSWIFPFPLDGARPRNRSRGRAPVGHRAGGLIRRAQRA